MVGGWMQAYIKKGALWMHDGNSKRPHALLASGKHSNGFFNSELVMEDAAMVADACAGLTQKLVSSGLELADVNRVVGPAMGAITLAHEMASQISRKFSGPNPCLRSYTEKVQDEKGKKRMVFKRSKIRNGESILLVEDVLTTGGSVELVKGAVEAAGGVVLPTMVVLVNRSGVPTVSGLKILALIDRHMPIWEPDECPLCKAGSEEILPKGVENWARLNDRYD